MHILKLTFFIILVFNFIGCDKSNGSSSSNSGNTNPVDDTKTGTFVDAPVKGLYYKTTTKSGYTDNNGSFKYKSGETVEFKLGTLSLGSVVASESINPLDLVGDADFGNIGTKAKNIAMLLQNLDQNRSDNSTIVIADTLKDYDFSTINLDMMSEADVNGLLADVTISANIDQINNTIITQATANTSMKNYLKEYLAGTYSGYTVVTGNYQGLCYGENNYVVNISTNGDDFNISMPYSIDYHTTISSFITSISTNFSSDSYVPLSSPNESSSLKIKNIKFNGKKMTGILYFKLYGRLACKEELHLVKQ